MSRAYIDAIMQNYGFSYNSETSTSESESSDMYEKQNLKHKKLFSKGGNNSADQPSGGFPNIILCSDNKQTEEIKENVTRREITADKAILSISQILNSRRNI